MPHPSFASRAIAVYLALSDRAGLQLALARMDRHANAGSLPQPHNDVLPDDYDQSICDELADCNNAVSFFAATLRAAFGWRVDTDLAPGLRQVEPRPETPATPRQALDWPAQLALVQLEQLVIAADAVHDATGSTAAAVASTVFERYTESLACVLSLSKTDTQPLSDFVDGYLHGPADADADGTTAGDADDADVQPIIARAS